MKSLAVIQPSYIPWLGYFDQIARSDIFVFYDDVQYDKNGWRNRNRIKTSQGPVWLSVPVLKSGRTRQLINEVEIDNSGPWARKHIKTIAQAYAKAPYVNLVIARLKPVLKRPWHFLSDLNIEIITVLCQMMGITTPLYRSSALRVEGDRNGRLIALCKHFNAMNYLSGNAAQSYLDVSAFEKCNLSVTWQNYRHPGYSQLHGPFMPHLSIVDLLMMVGPSDTALSILRGQIDNVQSN